VKDKLADEPVREALNTFNELYVTEFGQLVRFAALVVGSSQAAEDIVQDAFAKLHDRLDKIETPQAWSRTTVLNACRNERRRLGIARRYAPSLTRPAAALDEPVHELIASLRRLPYKQRAVVVLRFYGDLPEAEIARLLGIRLGTVKSSLHRALAQLQQEVQR
jgi:RNA polymerase sigma-70 factor (sigma-E family)